MKKILIIHPSRGRPQQAKKIYEHIHNTMSKENNLRTYIFCLDNDDPSLHEYMEISNDVHHIIGDNNGAVQAVNRAYDRDLLRDHDIAIIAADDIYFPEQWDSELVKVFDQYGYDKIVKTTNQFQGNLDLINLQVAGTQFWLDYTTFYWPEYINMFADDDLTIWAIKNGRYVRATHLFFAHMQYSLQMPQQVIDKYGPIPLCDSTYERENSEIGIQKGQEILERRRREGFPPHVKK